MRNEPLFDIAMKIIRILEHDTVGPREGVATLGLVLARLCCDPAIDDIDEMFLELRTLTETLSPIMADLVRDVAEPT